ncbi:SETMR methyltransferase, partial [Acromyrmex insinuator]
MDKNYFRSLIKHYFLKGKTAKETKEKLDKYYVANAPSDYTVKYWFREFRGGRNSTTDEIRSGRPSDAVTEENVKKIHEMVLADRKVKVRELADATKISTERTRHILGEILHMKKLSCRWVPRMLTPDQKHERESTSKEKFLDRGRPIAWLVRSSDLNSLDYFHWGYLKELIFIKILHCVGSITPEILQLTQRSLIHRANACIQMAGLHFENQI